MAVVVVEALGFLERGAAELLGFVRQTALKEQAAGAALAAQLADKQAASLKMQVLAAILVVRLRVGEL